MDMKILGFTLMKLQVDERKQRRSYITHAASFRYIDIYQHYMRFIKMQRGPDSGFRNI